MKFYLLYPSFSLFCTSFPQIASNLERDHFKNVCSNFVPLEYIRIDNKVVILLERLFFLNRILWVQVVIWLSTWHSYIIGIDEYPTSLVEVFSWKLIILIRHQVGRYIIRMCDWLFISLLDVCWFFYNSLLERIYIFLRIIWSRFQIILSALKPSITVTLRLHYLHFHVSDFCFLEPSRKKPNVRYIFLPSFSNWRFFPLFYLLQFRIIVWLSTRIAIFSWRTTTIASTEWLVCFSLYQKKVKTCCTLEIT